MTEILLIPGKSNVFVLHGDTWYFCDKKEVFISAQTVFFVRQKAIAKIKNIQYKFSFIN